MPYYELTGEVRQHVAELLAKNDAQEKLAWKLAKSYGAKGYTIGTGFGFRRVAGFVFKTDKHGVTTLPEGFRWNRYNDYAVPRVSTKHGKAIAARMRAIVLVGGMEFAKAIGMEPFKGLTCRSPGVSQYGRRVIVSVPDDVVPRGGKRISDVAVEKLKKRHQ